MLTGVDVADNSLSFIETSALDASNVELAFQNILTGTSYLFFFLICNQSVIVFLTSSQKSTELSPVKPSTVASHLKILWVSGKC